MRLIALFATLLLLSGCGFGDFLSDTHTFRSDPNSPLGNSENMRRVEGQVVDVTPLQTEPGNVWPGPVPSLSDLQREQGGAIAPELNPGLGGRPGQGNPPRAPLGNVPGTGAGDANPPGDGSVVVPNGNGTSTVIEPDGSVRTIPTPK
jgi:hypothetical protein